MANRRTGLQSEVSSIFSGVPIPRKGRSEPKPNSPAPKRTASAPSRSKASQPSAPKPQSSATPKSGQGVEHVKENSPRKIREVELSKKEIRSIPHAAPRRKTEKSRRARAGSGSTKQKIEMVLAVTLLMVLIVAIARPFSAAVQGYSGGEQMGQEKTGFLTRADVKINWPVPAPYPTDIRDPMVLDSEQPLYVEPEKPVVRGIVHSEDRPFAIIGIKMMQEGEQVQGATIVKINPDSVVFTKDGKQWTQEVEGEDM